MPIRFKLFFFFLLLMLIILGGMHVFLERNAVRAFYERENVAATNIVRVVMGDISHYYRNKVSYKLETLVRKRELMREAVTLALGSLDELHRMEREGFFSHVEARRRGAEWLRRQRYNANEPKEGRFVAFTSGLRGVVHPQKNREGASWEGFLNLKGRDALQDVVQEVVRGGGEFTIMGWGAGGKGVVDEHLAYFTYFQPWDWVVGTSSSLEGIRGDIELTEKNFIERLQEFFDSAADDLEGSLVLVDSNGDVVAYSGRSLPGALNVPAILDSLVKYENGGGLTKEYAMLHARAEEVEYAIFSDTFKAVNWKVYYLVPKSRLMQPARNLTQQQFQLLAGIFVLSLIPLFFLVRRFTGPLTMLAGYARSLPAKDFIADPADLEKVKEVAKAQNDEAGQLAAAFAAMQNRLDDYIRDLQQTSKEKDAFARKVQAINETLEKRVDERTNELNKANRELVLEIEERKAVSRALYESNAQLQGIFDHAPLMIWLKDLEGRITLVNNRFREFFGIQSIDIIGSRIEYLFDGDLARFSARDKEALISGQPETVEERLQMERGVAALLTTRFPLLDGEGNTFATCGVALDVTESKLLEADAFRSAHLASLGELAAIVAHEINNPINGVINAAEVIADSLEQKEIVEKYVKLIVDEGDRISGIVRSLLSYARPERQEFAPVSIPEILEEVLLFNNLQLRKEGVSVQVDAPAENPMVRGRPQELKQVLLNLIGNAREALNEKYDGAHENKVLRITVGPSGAGNVRICVRDNGQGIRLEDLSRVCDSFFTTKSPGQGAGLGLYVTKQIVDKHNGALRFSSEYGQYTQVDLELPVWQGE